MGQKFYAVVFDDSVCFDDLNPHLAMWATVWRRRRRLKPLAVYRRDGLTAWGSYTDGRYRSYRMDAQTAAASPAASSIIPDSLITPENAKIYIALAIGALLALKILRD